MPSFVRDASYPTVGHTSHFTSSSIGSPGVKNLTRTASLERRVGSPMGSTLGEARRVVSTTPERSVERACLLRKARLMGR